MNTIKIVIPMAGIGRRLEPLTKSRPKALIRLTDRRLLDHILDTFKPLEKTYDLEYIFIIGHLGEQIRGHMRETHPEKKVTYFVQEQLSGQSSAVYLAREAISGPVILTYCDTVNLTDFSFLPLKNADGAASVWEVEDPSRFGVAAVGPDGLVTKLVEKPKTKEHRSALTGIYFFSEGRELIRGIEDQFRLGTTVNNEYYLADAINILVQEGLRIRPVPVSGWLDAGTLDSLIETNASLLNLRPQASRPSGTGDSSILMPPCYIHESSQVEDSVIGPNVSIGADCIIRRSTLKNTIIDDGSSIEDAVLENSLVGMGCTVRGGSHAAILADHEERTSVA